MFFLVHQYFISYFDIAEAKSVGNSVAGRFFGDCFNDSGLMFMLSLETFVISESPASGGAVSLHSTLSFGKSRALDQHKTLSTPLRIPVVSSRFP